MQDAGQPYWLLLSLFTGNEHICHPKKGHVGKYLIHGKIDAS